ncbi:unnamed protein product [Amoebophrya sp. A120]|nr:unnamed protein product [Amoebophrya sp. A120]|eukprot:GSA120T00022413001.1
MPSAQKKAPAAPKDSDDWWANSDLDSAEEQIVSIAKLHESTASLLSGTSKTSLVTGDNLRISSESGSASITKVSSKTSSSSKNAEKKKKKKSRRNTNASSASTSAAGAEQQGNKDTMSRTTSTSAGAQEPTSTASDAAKNGRETTTREQSTPGARLAGDKSAAATSAKEKDAAASAVTTTSNFTAVSDSAAGAVQKEHITSTSASKETTASASSPLSATDMMARGTADEDQDARETVQFDMAEVKRSVVKNSVVGTNTKPVPSETRNSSTPAADDQNTQKVEKDVKGVPAQQDMEDIVVAGIVKDQNIEAAGAIVDTAVSTAIADSAKEVIGDLTSGTSTVESKDSTAAVKENSAMVSTKLPEGEQIETSKKTESPAEDDAPPVRNSLIRSIHQNMKDQNAKSPLGSGNIKSPRTSSHSDIIIGGPEATLNPRDVVIPTITVTSPTPGASPVVISSPLMPMKNVGEQDEQARVLKAGNKKNSLVADKIVTSELEVVGEQENKTDSKTSPSMDAKKNCPNQDKENANNEEKNEDANKRSASKVWKQGKKIPDTQKSSEILKEILAEERKNPPRRCCLFGC